MSISPLSPLAETCPNCRQPWPKDAAVCPNCGYIRPAAPVWPPPPEGQAAFPLPPVPRLITKSAGGDIALGVVLSLASFFLAGLGVVAMPVLYFVLRPTLPAFARGIGYGLLGGMVLVLGAFALCVGAIVWPQGH